MAFVSFTLLSSGSFSVHFWAPLGSISESCFFFFVVFRAEVLTPFHLASAALPLASSPPASIFPTSSFVRSVHGLGWRLATQPESQVIFSVRGHIFSG